MCDPDLEFQILDLASTRYWNDSDRAERFRQLLTSVSSEALNRYDQYGWTILAYVLWSLEGYGEEIKTLQTILGPDVVTEDHSRLRLDCYVFKVTDTSMVTFQTKHPKSAAIHPQGVQKCPPHEVLQCCAKSKDLIAFRRLHDFKANVQIAEELLHSAYTRVQTYPKRLRDALINVCIDCLPVQSLYTIITGYLCH
jgi:hypothetical protein